MLGAILTLFALYFSIQVYLERSNEDQPISITEALSRGLVFWLLWAISVPLILWLARAFPFRREHWSDALLLHLPAGTILSLAHLLVYVIITSSIAGQSPGSFEALLRQFQAVFLSSFAWWSLVYWTILLASYAFHFYERYQDGVVRASQLESQLAHAELQALKMQLNPHFLFNTLHSISALMHEDVEVADKMVARLGEFLRMTLKNSGSPEITLEEEVKFLECYLEIEQLRFEDRLLVQFEIDPLALSARVPNLILQPVVENAIRHGIATQTAPGRLAIRARRLPDRLHLEVEDNGPGFPAHFSMATEHSARAISTSQTGTNAHSNGGLGLVNTSARLARHFGPEHQLAIERASPHGAIVRIEIPLRLEGDDDHV